MATDAASKKRSRNIVAADPDKRDFLANMSHELRTPMNGVFGMTQLLKATPLTAQQQEYLDCLEVSAQSLMYLLNDIIDLACLDSGQIELKPSHFSLRATLSNIVKTQQYELNAKGISFQLDIPTTIPDMLSGDQLRAKQIILNLLGNAVKFTEEGAITLSVAALEQVDDQLLLEITVRDTGIGIPAEQLEQLFSPAERVTRRFAGSGLGLSISTRLADLMGGRLWAESSVGVGSSFHIAMPFTVVRRNASELLDQGQRPQDAVRGEQQLNILLAEDNAVSRRYASVILETMGHTVTAVADGSKALKNWNKGDYDLILMDILMPVMDGIAATAAIRAEESGKGTHTPIVAITAHTMQEEIELLLASGFDGYIPKPFEIDNLIEEIRRVCPTGS